MIGIQNTMDSLNTIIEFSHISKQFPGVKALNDITFSIRKGEVHALVGENGAGKSTLLNILHGVYSVYAGEIKLAGSTVNFRNTHDAITAGIAKVHQEVSLINNMSIGQNILLGYEPVRSNGFIDYPKMYSVAQVLLDKMKCKLQSSALAERISTGEMQMISIAKSLYHNANVISFDEPTASLSKKETEVLFSIISDLKSQGITSLYVSHRLEEIFSVADRVTVLRDGCYIGTWDIKNIDREFLIHKMVGRDVSAFARRVKNRAFTDETVLKVENLSSDGIFHDISFELKKGEILGFSGLVGAKRTDVAKAIFGVEKVTSGKMFLHGEQISITSPTEAVNKGIGLIPENRKTEGLINNLSNEDNIAIACLRKFTYRGFINHKKKRENCMYYIKQLNLSPPDPEYLTESLSGGNQQKVILARWLSPNVDILIFDEPTKGVDVGAKAEIYRLMEDLVESGKSLIVISSELPEIIGICDRVIIMHEGKKMNELSFTEFSEEKILHYAMGGS